MAYQTISPATKIKDSLAILLANDQSAHDEAAAKIPLTQKGAANGVTPLGPDSKVPAAYLPSYVDDVLEFSGLSAFPSTGEAGKIYIAIDTNRTYRWGGSAYINITASPGTTDAVPEGANNKYFTDARAQAALVAALSNKVDTTDTRLTNSREWTATAVTQAEAQAGTASTARKWTALRVRQAIAAWWIAAIPLFGRNLAESSNAAAARATLELGTSATRNVGTSDNDVMQVGAFGLGGQGATYDYSSTTANSLGGGFFTDGVHSTIVARRSDQTGVEFSGDYTGDKFYARRFRTNDGGWQPRRELYHTGNFSPNTKVDTTGDSVTGRYRLNTTDDGVNDLQVGGDTSLRGKVGVGNDNPSDAVDVAGDIRVREQGQAKFGGTGANDAAFAIQFNPATNSLDFNYLGA